MVSPALGARERPTVIADVPLGPIAFLTAGKAAQVAHRHALIDTEGLIATGTTLCTLFTEPVSTVLASQAALLADQLVAVLADRESVPLSATNRACRGPEVGSDSVQLLGASLKLH